MKRSDVEAYAEEIACALAPACEEVALAGSLRREREDVGDAEAQRSVEIVALPVWDTDLLGDREDHSSRLDACLYGLLASGKLAWDPALLRRGPRYRRLIITKPGIPLDLFLADGENFGCILAIRTGDAVFSRALVTERYRQFVDRAGNDVGGLRPRGMRQADGYLWDVSKEGRREIIPCRTEAHYLAALGVPYLHPRERDAEGVAKLHRMIAQGQR